MLSSILEMDEVWRKWLGRIAVTAVLVVGYHWYTGGLEAANGSSADKGVTLEEDWQTKRLLVLEERLAALEREKQEEAMPYEQDEVDIESEEEDYVDVDPSEAKDMLAPAVEALSKENAERKEKERAEVEARKKLEQQEEKENSAEAGDDEAQEEEPLDEKTIPERKASKRQTKKEDSEIISVNEVHETAEHRRRRARNRVFPQGNSRTDAGADEESNNPPIAATSDEHPGLTQFNYWYNTETSLYRIYELGRTDEVPVVPPFHPASERGKVPVALVVGNKYYEQINVFWTDYKGREVPKGRIPSGGTWHQTTWIGHPWTFRTVTGEILLHCIPYRVIPTTKQVPTIDPNDSSVGLHQFVIGRPGFGPWNCSVIDPVLPHPPELALNTPVKAAQWCLQHMTRTGYAGGEILAKYLTNIVANPDNPKYRQIRTAQPKFNAAVWNTAARGLLLACGFVEREAFAELGTMSKLSRERVRDVSTLLFALEQWRMEQGEVTVYDQPDGADGYGRGGFGRAGEMNDNF